MIIIIVNSTIVFIHLVDYSQFFSGTVPAYSTTPCLKIQKPWHQTWKAHCALPTDRAGHRIKSSIFIIWFNM